MNEQNPKSSACVLVLPDLARDSSLRGLYDEEKQLFEELFSLAQSVETRWVEVYTRENRRADSKSNCRRFGAGRIITSSSSMAENGFLDSELAVYGRVIGPNEGVEGQGAPLAVLPRTASLLIPEPASPEAWLDHVLYYLFSSCFLHVFPKKIYRNLKTFHFFLGGELP